MTKVPDGRRKRRQLMFKTPDGLVPLAQLSDGFQNMAAWCGDLLYRVTETFKEYRKRAPAGQGQSAPQGAAPSPGKGNLGAVGPRRTKSGVQWSVD